MQTKQKPRMSEEAVEAKTGKNWGRWFKHLDAAGAKKMSHQEIAAHLSEKHGVRPWWTQMVAVTYEQARGLRNKHEEPQGYEISVSRTIDASVSKAFKAWADDKTRKKWLPSNLTIRKATANKSLRITWSDTTTSVAVAFAAKAKAKTQVVAQHSKLPDAKAAAKMKKFWAAALDRLKGLLE
ncbi:MAG TPA: SRPBCC domain-containing protein [Pyrinomonadaceae bacterium]|nr:SRPBCC domain-containing protein [Pyrinomonadaceae bacterium]